MIEKILIKASNIDKDKLLHFFYGFITFNIASIFLSFWFSLLIVGIVGILKEVYDCRDINHETSILDFIYTILPGAIQSLIFYI